MTAAGQQDSASATRGAATFVKGLRLLQTIAALPGPARLKDIQRASALPRATLYRLLGALEGERFVVRDPLHGGYLLGPELARLGYQSRIQNDLPRGAREALVAIRDATGETVHLAVPRGDVMVYVDKVESLASVRMASMVGNQVHMHASAVGKAFLAALAPEALDRYAGRLALEPMTANTVTGLPALRAALETVRAQGYAVDDEENEPGIVCFGRALYGVDGQPLASVSVSVPRYRLGDDWAHRYAGPIRTACEAAGLLMSQPGHEDRPGRPG
ncbi:IclR family transcriptional regulator [Arhodomonas aquaeolei]|uniref:IclR family transcriptional regulator n=1 Tax=Arhodomonas aquaeolei TaxID=2369 RepID=UPI0021693B35|nr:IclR family transcriptional regulator [Arhodomonas aquaeolei]MCS4504816.1 IclR family transcriptional regulator [Arhodomonas aquaeolei]